jgi:hypothetical protein
VNASIHDVPKLDRVGEGAMGKESHFRSLANLELGLDFL